MTEWATLATLAVSVLILMVAIWALPRQPRISLGLVTEGRRSDEVWESALYTIPVRMHGEFRSGRGVALVRIVNRSRHDISSESFDGGFPMELDIGVRIVGGEFRSWPPDRPAPAIKADGTKLMIGPSLIGKRQEIYIVLVTAGGEPKLAKCSPLRNVKVEVGGAGLPVRDAVTLVVRPAGRKAARIMERVGAMAVVVAPVVPVLLLHLGEPAPVLAGLASAVLIVPVAGNATARLIYPNHYKLWTPRANHALALAHWADPDPERLSRKFGRRRSAIESRLRRLGVLDNADKGSGTVDVIGAGEDI